MKRPVLATLAPPAFVLLATLLAAPPEDARAYPPGVGILSKEKTCLGCHAANGPWKDDEFLIADILDPETKKSHRQESGAFAISVKRAQAKTVLVVIGRKKDDPAAAPLRSGWLFVDPKTIETTSLSKFAPGWEVNLPGACRIFGDKLEGYAPAEGGRVTALPMTIRPGDGALDAEIAWQLMITKGESVKGKAREGMIGSYFERTVKLRVLD